MPTGTHAGCPLVGTGIGTGGSNDEKGLSVNPSSNGKMTVSVTTGTAAVVEVGPAAMHEQALSNRYATSP